MKNKNETATVTTLPHGYAPMVGDNFHRPKGTYTCPISGDQVPTPERTARVTMVSPRHVVVIIDGKERTMQTDDFIRIAENTIRNGSTLIRANTSG